MFNRLKGYFEPFEDQAPANDFYVVVYGWSVFYVTREVADRILRDLDARSPPRWIRFTDLSGSRVSVRSARISFVFESTFAQRAAERAFDRARRLEEKADRRPWEDED